ncbi:hypothetical protein FCJ59_00185 [Cupriavidus basilensis]|nr:hypothetical protein [Cupriavidus basilensis]
MKVSSFIALSWLLHKERLGAGLQSCCLTWIRLIENLGKIVFNGAFVQQGMPDLTGKLTSEDVAKIQAFIQGTADAVRPKKP